MPKKPIDEKDWGRIYAFIWKEHGKPDSINYKEMFEQNPMNAIVAIDTALRDEGYDGIDYDTQLFEIGDMPDDFVQDPTLLDKVIRGEAVAFLQMRLTC